MRTTEREERRQRDLFDVGIADLYEAVAALLAHLAEPEPEAAPGSYWTLAEAPDDETAAARIAAGRRALGELQTFLAWAEKQDGRKSDDNALRATSLLLGEIDRQLSDPKSGFKRRLRRVRSALLRARLAKGATMTSLAREEGISVQRISVLVRNNKSYVSATRQMALQQLKEDGAAAREAAKAETARRRAEKREREAAAAREARIAEGRALSARLASGEDRDVLLEQTGMSRQRLASLLAEVRRADEQG